MKTHRHLTYSDRCQIYALLKRGISRADIARDIGVHRSTISRELRRNLQPTAIIIIRQPSYWRNAADHPLIRVRRSDFGKAFALHSTGVPLNY